MGIINVEEHEQTLCIHEGGKNMNLKKFKSYASYFWYAEIYFVLANIYLFKLLLLNKQLVSQNFPFLLELVRYKNSLPLKYLGWAAIFIITGLLICGFCGYKIVKSVRSESELISYAIVFVITFIIVGLILIASFFPILISAIIVALGGVAGIWLVTNRKN